MLRSMSSPPKSVASSRLMASPRPVPPYCGWCWRRLLEGLEHDLLFSTGMPTPVS